MKVVNGFVQRYLGFGLLLAMAGFAAVGYLSIRRDVENLRVISQDNILWTATQMEVELLRFQLSVSKLEMERDQAALDEMRERFDLLWSRIFMMGQGRVGTLIETYDEGHGSIPAFQHYLRELDPVLQEMKPDDTATVRLILRELETFQRDLRLYTLRVVRGDTAASADVRDRIQYSSQTTVLISLAAVLLSVLALSLILRENRRQRELAELNRRIALEAEQSSRAKSRFLTMMSHELRNPLNGVMGPLALLSQVDLPSLQRRLVAQARQSGGTMVQMLAGLLDYAEMQDGRFVLRVEPMRLGALADGVRKDLEGASSAALSVRLDPDAPEAVYGDVDRLRHIFVHLAEYVLEGSEPRQVRVAFRHDGDNLVGELAFAGPHAAIDWKLDLMMGLSEVAPDQVSTDALRPLLARGLIAAARGVLSLVDGADGERAINVLIPAPPVRYERIRVRLETRSVALEAIYKAALRSDRVSFIGPDEPGDVDLVLVDATSVADEPTMSRLRERYADALFVALGAPQRPETFDEIVESPADMGRLRSRILGRLTV
jgi:signal transduction histidine kinase